MEGEEEEEFRFTFHRFSQLRIRIVNKQIPVYFVDKFNPFSLSLVPATTKGRTRKRIN